MKKNFLIFVLTCMVCTTTQYAMALGIGGYFTSSIKSGDFGFHRDDYEYMNIGNRSADALGGIGFVLDTNLAQDKLFNYRLQIGADRFKPKDTSTKSDLGRISFINSLGFGLIKTTNVRYWVGPQFAIRYVSGDKNFTYYGHESISIPYQSYYGGATTVTGFLRDKIKYEMAGVDAGLISGLNINIGPVITVALESGVRNGYLYGVKKRKVSNALTYMPINTFRNNVSDSYIEAFATIAVLFRINDSYN